MSQQELSSKDLKSSLVTSREEIEAAKTDERCMVYEQPTYTRRANPIPMEKKSEYIRLLRGEYEAVMKKHPRLSDQDAASLIHSRASKEIQRFIDSHSTICKTMIFARGVPEEARATFDRIFKVATKEVDDSVDQTEKDIALFELQNSVFESCLRDKDE